ncbi:IS66 family transposase, partial [Halomonas llamarensis]|nr:hypothetical protein [Halomonas llamarensis]
EKQAKALDPDARHALREQKSQPLIAQLRTWLDKSLAQVLPKSKRAINHIWAGVAQPGNVSFQCQGSSVVSSSSLSVGNVSKT